VIPALSSSLDAPSNFQVFSLSVYSSRALPYLIWRVLVFVQNISKARDFSSIFVSSALVFQIAGYREQSLSDLPAAGATFPDLARQINTFSRDLELLDVDGLLPNFFNAWSDPNTSLQSGATLAC
jgi:hypothetical protein